MMKKALIILIVMFSVFLAIGCAENKSGTPNETITPAKNLNDTATPAKSSNETVKETPGAGTTPPAVTPKETPAVQQNATEAQNEINTPTIKEFTLEELAQYNGKNGTSYVAYQGKVYDVSSSSLWKNGVHKGHSAGKDLTEELNSAPHGSNMLKGFPVVGNLKK